MADNIVEQNSLVHPLKPGVDHSNFNKLPEAVGKEIGLPTQALAPTDKTAQDLAEANVADYLEKMGATNAQQPQNDESAESTGDKIGEAARSILPGWNDDTARFVESGIGDELVRAKISGLEEKKTA